MLDNMLRKNGIEWSNIVEGVGLFYLAPLTEEQIKLLKQDYGIYVLHTGRINIAGLSEEKINYFVDSLVNILK